MIKNIPRAIYFDTNVIRNLKLENTSSDFLEFKEKVISLSTPTIPLFIPQVVRLEWVKHHFDIFEKKYDQTRGNIREIEQLLSIQQPKLKIPLNAYEVVMEAFDKKLKNLGFSVIETPKNISLNDLVQMAAFKIKPFEDKGEKGFRDSIELFTILEHAKENRNSTVLMVTNDEIFSHEDVKAIVKKYNIEIEIVRSFKEGSEYIDSIVDSIKTGYVNMRNRTLIEFLENKTDVIFDFVKNNTEITEDFIVKNGFLSEKYDIIGQINNVLNFLPTKIINAFYRNDILTDYTSYPKNVDPISISVETEITVNYSPIDAFNRPSVKAQDLSNFKEKISSASATFQYYGAPIETKVKRTVTVYGEVKKGQNFKIESLKLDRVSAF